MLRQKQFVKGPRGPRRGGRQQGQGGGRSLSVPPFTATVQTTHRFRFANTTNSGQFSITRKNLLNLLQVATSTVTTVRLLQAVRLKSVEMWGNPIALGSPPTELRLEWSGENSPSTFVSDFGMGVRPAHVRTTPPASSSNRWWSISGSSETDVLFILLLPANVVIDVSLELRFVDAEAPTAGDVPVGATLGQLYANYLDGKAGSKLSPVDYQAIP